MRQQPRTACVVLLAVVSLLAFADGRAVDSEAERARRATCGDRVCGVNSDGCDGDKCDCINGFTGSTCNNPPGTDECDSLCGGGEYTAECESNGSPICEGCSAKCREGQTYELNGCGDGGLDRHCTPCTECSNDEYEHKPCYTGSDRECKRCVECDDDEYETSECGGEDGDEDRKCETCSQCGAGNHYVKKACTHTADTVCARCDECEGGTYQVADCNGVDNRECKACTECSASEFVTRECQAAGYMDRNRQCQTCKVCRAGQEYETRACGGDDNDDRDEDRRCATCRKCDADEWESQPCEGRQNRRCSRCLVCGNDEYEVSACTATRNAVCAKCQPKCANPYYQTRDCAFGASPGNGINGSDRECSLCKECAANHYEVTACGLHSRDRTCTPCRDCKAGVEFEVRSCNEDLKDRTCRACDACGSDEYEEVACTPTTNRVCRGCQVRCGDGWYELNVCGNGSTSGERSCSPCSQCDLNEIAYLPCGFLSNRGRRGRNRQCGAPFWLSLQSVALFSDDAASGRPAAKAADGDISSYFKAAFVPSEDRPATLYFDFGNGRKGDGGAYTVAVNRLHLVFEAGTIKDGYIERGTWFSSWDHDLLRSDVGRWDLVHDFHVLEWETEHRISFNERWSRHWRIRITGTYGNVPARLSEVRMLGGHANWAAELAPLKEARPDFEVFWISQAVLPDETVLAVGHDMQYANYVEACYTIAQKVCEKLPVMDATRSSIKFTIPAQWPTAVYQFEVCDRSKRCRASALRVNSPEVWWFRGNHGDVASRRGWVRIFGNSLAYKNGHCVGAAAAHANTAASVRLVADDGTEYELQQRASSCYSLLFQVPGSVPDATYAIEMQNGLLKSTTRIGAMSVSGDAEDDVYQDKDERWAETGQLCTDVRCRAADQCHEVGVCRGGKCSHPLKPDGSDCDDGNAATPTDFCLAGVCVGRADPLCEGVRCVAKDQCHDRGRCVAGVCSDPPKQTGSDCNDGDPDTIEDVCNDDGVCEGHADPCAGVVCAAKGECYERGECESGECSNPVKADNSACGGGVCRAGLCVASSPCDAVECGAASDQCHEPGECEVVGGEAVCTDPKKEDDEACEDGNPNTANDRCQGGVCVSGADLCASIVCRARSQCHKSGSCSEGVCSASERRQEGGRCDDHDDSTASDICTDLDGQEWGCRGTNPCTGVVCEGATQCRRAGVCEVVDRAPVCRYEDEEVGEPCDDGDDSTVDDQCFDGLCAGVDRCATTTCEPLSDCHKAGVCEGGECTTPVRVGAACADGDGATQGDVCHADGECRGWPVPFGYQLAHTGVFGDRRAFDTNKAARVALAVELSLAECAALCSASPVAVGFAFDRDSSACSLLLELAEVAEERNTVASYRRAAVPALPAGFELFGTGGAGDLRGYQHTADVREILAWVTSLQECADLCRASETCRAFTISMPYQLAADTERKGGECRGLHTLEVVAAPNFVRATASFRDKTKAEPKAPTALDAFTLRHESGGGGGGKRFDKTGAVAHVWDEENLTEEQCAARALLNPLAIGVLFRQQDDDDDADTECTLLTAIKERSTAWTTRSYARTNRVALPAGYRVQFTGSVGDGWRLDAHTAHTLDSLTGVTLNQCVASANGHASAQGFTYDWRTKDCKVLHTLVAALAGGEDDTAASFVAKGHMIVPDGYSATHVTEAGAAAVGVRWAADDAFLLYRSAAAATPTACATVCELNYRCEGFLFTTGDAVCRTLHTLVAQPSRRAALSFTRQRVPAMPASAVLQHTGAYGDGRRWSTSSDRLVDDDRPLTLAQCERSAAAKAATHGVLGFVFEPEDGRCRTVSRLDDVDAGSRAAASFVWATRGEVAGYQRQHTGKGGDGQRFSTAVEHLEFTAFHFTAEQCAAAANRNPRAVGFVLDGDRCRTVRTLHVGNTNLVATSYKRRDPPAAPAGFRILHSGRWGDGARWSTAGGTVLASRERDETAASCAKLARDQPAAMGFVWSAETGACEVLNALRLVPRTTRSVTSYALDRPAGVPDGYRLAGAGDEGAGGDGFRYSYSQSRLLYSRAGETVDSCAVKCDASPLCAGFLFAAGEGEARCRLLRSLARKRTGQVGVRSFERKAGVPAAPGGYALAFTGRVGPENKRWDTAPARVLLDESSVASVAACARKADGADGAEGFLYAFQSQRCVVVNALVERDTTAAIASYRATTGSRRQRRRPAAAAAAAAQAGDEDDGWAAGAAVPAAIRVVRRGGQSPFYAPDITYRAMARSRQRRLRPQWSSKVFDAARYGGIVEAIEAARERDGGIVHVADGTWKMEDGQTLVLPANVILRGKGKGRTVLKWPENPQKNVKNLIQGEYGAYQVYGLTVEVTGRFENIFETDYLYRTPSHIGIIHGTRIHDVEIKTTNNALNHSPRSAFSIGTDDVEVTDCVVTMAGGCGAGFPRATVFYVRGASNVLIARNRVEFSCWCWNFELTRNVVYEDNWQHAIGTITSGGQTISTYGGVSNVATYIANNYMNDEHINPDTLSLISLDARGAAYLGRVSSGSGTRVVIRGDPQFQPAHKTNWAGGLLTVLRGTGAGQAAVVRSHDAAGKTWTLATALKRALDDTSVITIGYMRGLYHIVGNYFTKGDQVQMYGASHAVIIAENTFVDTVGTGAWGRYIEGVQPSNYVQFLDNQLYDARRMISQTGYDTRGTAASFFRGPSCRGHVHRRNYLAHRTHLLIQGTVVDSVAERNVLADIQGLTPIEVDRYVSGVFLRRNTLAWLAINSYTVENLTTGS